MALVEKVLYDFGSDESSAADDDDFKSFSPRGNPRFASCDALRKALDILPIREFCGSVIR